MCAVPYVVPRGVQRTSGTQLSRWEVVTMVSADVTKQNFRGLHFRNRRWERDPTTVDSTRSDLVPGPTRALARRSPRRHEPLRAFDELRTEAKDVEERLRS